MDIPDLHWRVQTQTIEQIHTPPRMLQDLIFGNRHPVAAKYIEVDIVKGGQKLAPFVTDIEGGTIMENTKRADRVVKTPRIRPKKMLTADDLQSTKAPGQIYYAGGVTDINKARLQKIAIEQKEMKNTILNRIEWMCAQALTGSMTVSQDNIAFVIDYLMPAAHKIVLSGADRWSESTATLRHNINAWAQMIIDALGHGPTIAICGSDAASALEDRIAEDKWFDSRSLSPGGEFTWNASSNYMGRAGGIEFYRYGSKYKDTSNVVQSMFPANKMYLVATGARFSVEFGMITDMKAGANVVGEIFSKSWEEEDPSGLWLLSESRPLPVVWEPEAIIEVQVVD